MVVHVFEFRTEVVFLSGGREEGERKGKMRKITCMCRIKKRDGSQEEVPSQFCQQRRVKTAHVVGEVLMEAWAVRMPACLPFLI